MANLTLAKDNNGDLIPVAGYGSTQKVDGTSASAQSAVISATEECVVRIAAVGDLYVEVGTNPTATTSKVFFPAGHVEEVKIPANHKIAVIGAVALITTLG